MYPCIASFRMIIIVSYLYLYVRSESSSIKQGMVATQRMITKVWFHVVSTCHKTARRSFYSRTCTSLKTPMAAILHQLNVRNLQLLQQHQALSRSEEVVPEPLQKNRRNGNRWDVMPWDRGSRHQMSHTRSLEFLGAQPMHL